MSGRARLAQCTKGSNTLSQSNANGRGRANPALRLRAIREIHTYIGVFFAPTLLFFAATGALQLFKLHEPHAAYAPYPVVEKLGQLHKEQLWETKPKRPPPPPGEAKKAEPAKPKAPPPADPPSMMVLKWFFLAAAVGLISSTLLGVWMALVHGRRPKVALALLALGAAAPFLILNLL